ncbi:Cullin-3B [Thelohanellus kitauei]|uniref:Cullin-3B n=1 Tax=Thelohanellus kitauei TaxID=669202 RepID=A0A0C2IJM3_THEKT|nr:Cullin-3B [Thelohanellus kitauei]
MSDMNPDLQNNESMINIGNITRKLMSQTVSMSEAMDQYQYHLVNIDTFITTVCIMRSKPGRIRSQVRVGSLESLFKHFHKNIFDQLCYILDEYLVTTIRNISRSPSFIDGYVEEFKKFECAQKRISFAYKYLDNFWRMQTDPEVYVCRVKQLFLIKWGQTVVHKFKLKTDDINTLTTFMTHLDSLIDKPFYDEMIKIPKPDSIYWTEFVDKLCSRTHYFYEDYGLKHVDLNTASYLTLIQNHMNRNKRMLESLKPKLANRIVKIINHQCITRLKAEILKGFEEVLKHERLNEIKIFYLFFKNTESIILEMLPIYQRESKNKITGILYKETEPQRFVSICKDMFKKYDYITHFCFNFDLRFDLIKNSVFTDVLNNGIGENSLEKISIKMVKVLDQITRNSDFIDSEQIRKIKNIIRMLTYLPEHTIFGNVYIRYMSTRFTDNVFNSKTETKLLNWFYKILDSHFVSQIKVILQDYDNCQKLNNEFLTRSDVSRCKMIPYYTILSANSVPKSSNNEIVIPSDINPIFKSFQNYYTSKYKTRKIVNHHTLSHVELDITSKQGVTKLHCNGCQAIVILLFRGKSRLSYKTISESTKLTKVKIC